MFQVNSLLHRKGIKWKIQVYSVQVIYRIRIKLPSRIWEKGKIQLLSNLIGLYVKK